MDSIEANIMDKSMRSVFVGNIPYEATEEKLKDIFGEVGQVLSFKLVYDRETGKPKGYGFCEYRDQETALSAMRNLNSYEIFGRTLRVDNACTEKSRMEMQNLLNQPPMDNPYGEPIQAEKAPEAICKAVASLPPEQMFELMKQMKLCIQNNPAEARQMLLQNPQLSYALLQAQVVMRIIDVNTACTMLHPHQPVPSTLASASSDKPSTGSASSNSNFVPTPVQPPRQEFQPVPAPVMVSAPQAPAFVPQDVDLRSLDVRSSSSTDLRMPRIGDQDMRSLPAPPLTNPLPPPVNESFPKADTKPESIPRDPRDPRDPRHGPSTYVNDPRPAPRLDPRQKNIPPAPVRVPGQAPVQPPVTQPAVQRPIVTPQPQVSANIGPAGASDQEKAALIMQVLQLSDEQIAMLPPEQRNSILVLKEQIAKSAHRS